MREALNRLLAKDSAASLQKHRVNCSHLYASYDTEQLSPESVTARDVSPWIHERFIHCIHRLIMRIIGDSY